MADRPLRPKTVSKPCAGRWKYDQGFNLPFLPFYIFVQSLETGEAIIQMYSKVENVKAKTRGAEITVY